MSCGPTARPSSGARLVVSEIPETRGHDAGGGRQRRRGSGSRAPSRRRFRRRASIRTGSRSLPMRASVGRLTVRHPSRDPRANPDRRDLIRRGRDDQQGVVVLSPHRGRYRVRHVVGVARRNEGNGRQGGEASVGGGKRAEALCVGRRVGKIRPWRMPGIGVGFPIAAKGQPLRRQRWRALGLSSKTRREESCQ
jgi:hypothetical protein